MRPVHCVFEIVNVFSRVWKATVFAFVVKLLPAVQFTPSGLVAVMFTPAPPVATHKEPFHATAQICFNNYLFLVSARFSLDSFLDPASSSSSFPST